MINDKNLLKENQEIISNLSTNDLKNKLADLKKKNEGLEKEIKQVDQDQNQAIFNLKCKFEMDARKQMEARAVELAIENADQ